jgi:aminoglycoside phosphotransferase
VEISRLSPSLAPDTQIPHNLSQSGSIPPSPPHFAAPTIKTPNTSHTYRDIWLLRKYVLTFAVPSRKSSLPPREVLLVGFPIRVVIKYGTEIELSEASTLRFLAKTTSIPVPKVHCAFQRGKMKYIMMEYVKGESIRETWAGRQPAEKEKLLKQLRGYFDELRNIPHPRPGVICSAKTGPLFDRCIYKDKFGPFANETDFNNFLRCGVGQGHELGDAAEFYRKEGVKAAFSTLMAMQNKESSMICFTHADANGTNILVRGKKVVALIDFETSGFYPEYWEHTTAMTNAMNVNDTLWKEEIGSFLREYPRQLEMERLRRELSGVYEF